MVHFLQKIALAPLPIFKPGYNSINDNNLYKTMN